MVGRFAILCMQACIIGMFAMLMRILGLNKIYTNALTKSNFLNYHYSRRFLWWASMDKYNFNSNLNLPIYILYLPLKKLSIRPCLYNIFIPDVEGLQRRRHKEPAKYRTGIIVFFLIGSRGQGPKRKTKGKRYMRKPYLFIFLPQFLDFFWTKDGKNSLSNILYIFFLHKKSSEK